jgi:uncharacterized coiled-coil protein SlyX
MDKETLKRAKRIIENETPAHVMHLLAKNFDRITELEHDAELDRKRIHKLNGNVARQQARLETQSTLNLTEEQAKIVCRVMGWPWPPNDSWNKDEV